MICVSQVLVVVVEVVVVVVVANILLGLNTLTIMRQLIYWLL